MDAKVIEEMARALALHFRSENKNNSPETIKEATKLFMDAARAAYPFARAAALREAAGIAADEFPMSLEGEFIAAAILKEAETTEGKQ